MHGERLRGAPQRLVTPTNRCCSLSLRLVLDFPTFPETYHPHPADRTPWVSDSDSQSEYMTNNDHDLLQPRRFILDSGVQTGQVSVPFFP